MILRDNVNGRFLQVHKISTRGKNRKLHQCWRGMIRRCEDQSSGSYCRYGGKGITVCNEWHDYDAFAEWALTNGWNEGLQIDRVDNTQGYQPSNCRFVTPKENAQNRSSSVVITYMGLSLCIKEWARRINIPYRTLHNRIHNGWSVKRALTTPQRKAVKDDNHH